MKKLYFPLSSLAAALAVAACGGYETVTPAPQATTAYVTPTQPTYVAPVVVASGPVITQPGMVAVVPQQAVVVQTTPALQPGLGRVDSLTPLSNGTRIAVRMESGGRLQYLDTPGGTMVALGQRVEVTGDGHLSYPVPDRR
jgi:hypothetical protein